MYDALRDPIAQPLLAQGSDDILALHFHQVMWALNKVLKSLILTLASRALADSCDALPHVHGWKPAVHYLIGALKHQPEQIKFKVEAGDEKLDEIVSFNDMCDFIEEQT